LVRWEQKISGIYNVVGSQSKTYYVDLIWEDYTISSKLSIKQMEKLNKTKPLAVI
jgi:hypothetical protein